MIKRSKEDNKLHVLVSPKIESCLIGEKGMTINPVIFKGSPEEIDKNFFDQIMQPLFKFNETALSIQQMEKDLEELKEAAKKGATTEKSKVTKDSKKKTETKPVEKEVVEKDDDEVQELEEVAEEVVEEVNEETDDNSLPVENRPEYLESLGFTFDKKTLSYINGNAKISQREMKLLVPEQFDLLVQKTLKEIAPEKAEGAEQVNAFNGNATGVGVKDISKEKTIKASPEVLKASKQPITADTKLPEPKKEENSPNEIEFF